MPRVKNPIRVSDKTRFTELALFEALVSFIVAHAALSTQGTSEWPIVLFYVIILVMNLVTLILIYMYTGKEGQLVDYNENMTPSSYVWVLGGLIGVFFVALVITSQFKASSIFVPSFSTVVDTAGVTSLMWSVLYNIGLVANAEETTKLVGINAIYMYLEDNFDWIGETAMKVIAVTIPIGFWAVLHAYVAYVGPLMWPLVASAFAAGIVIFIVMYKTKSLLAAILVHGCYNVLVLSGSAMGWFNVSQSNTVLTIEPVYLISMQTIFMVFVLLNRRHRQAKPAATHRAF